MTAESFITPPVPHYVDHAAFVRRGWCGPIPLLTSRGIDQLGALYARHRGQFTQSHELGQFESAEQLSTRPWFKSMHMCLPLCTDIATHPTVLQSISTILGEDLIVWGFSVVEREIGQRHRWHADVEHEFGPGVTLFLGLEGATPEASLTVYEESQNVVGRPQDLSLNTDSDVLEYGRRNGIMGQLTTVPVSEGSFFLMHGALWHRSENVSTRSRLAAIIQYSTARIPVRIPSTWNKPVRWLRGTPPCLRVRSGIVVRDEV